MGLPSNLQPVLAPAPKGARLGASEVAGQKHPKTLESAELHGTLNFISYLRSAEPKKPESQVKAEVKKEARNDRNEADLREVVPRKHFRLKHFHIVFHLFVFGSYRSYKYISVYDVNVSIENRPFQVAHVVTPCIPLRQPEPNG